MSGLDDAASTPATCTACGWRESSPFLPHGPTCAPCAARAVRELHQQEWALEESHERWVREKAWREKGCRS